MPHLDSLRTFAVFAVAFHHWAPARLAEMLPFASGVQLFFVLSGFLITNILLEFKIIDERNCSNQKPGILKAFYIRRFLRIFPLYYVVLTAATLLGMANLRNDWIWHYAYLSNYCFIARQAFDGAVTHFWSLAVEEQFYMFWPLVVLWVKQDRLVKVFTSFVVAGVVYRWVGAVCFPEIRLWNVATPGSFDSLAMGALLAYGRRFSAPWFLKFRSLRLTGIIASMVLFACSKAAQSYGFGVLYFDDLFLSVAFVSIVSLAADGMGGLAGYVLDFKFLQYLGKISYGIYVYHNFMMRPANYIVHHFPQLEILPATHMMVKLVLTVGISALSWHLFESRINSLKKYFPYYRKPA